MGLSARQQLKYWGIAAVAAIAFVWLMGNTLVPFIIGAAIAYLLDPAADWLENHGLSRVASTAVITGFGVIIVVFSMLLVIPILGQQIVALVQAVPSMVGQFGDFLINRFPQLLDEESAIRTGLASMESTLASGGIALVQKVLSSSLAFIDLMLILFVSPVVAFYLLLDWDRMMARIDDLLPREHVGTIRGLGHQVDAVLSGFVRGQLTVCLILGTFYAVALGVIGLQFGVVVGLIAGLVSFIPYVGSITGGALSIGLALFQYWGDPQWIALVALVFVIGQLVEGNYLTPKLVGDSVGLHPVWLLFALSAFGSVLGFAGMMIAVPVSAVIGVMFRFGLRQYKDGRLYRGSEAEQSSEAAE